MPKKVLIVEDDNNIAQLLQLYLEKEGFETAVAKDGSRGVEEFRAFRPDLVLLDIMMPVMDGWAVLRKIREDGDTPVIMLTAKGELEDRVHGLESGADDYIVKPFSNAELLMRVRAILRRSAVYSVPQTPKNQIAISDLILDLDSQCVLRGGKTISLTYTEFKILELLARNKKKIFSLEHIYQAIWEDNAVGNDAIMVHIKNIRKKLGDSSRSPLYIKTAWGKGYYID